MGKRGRHTRHICLPRELSRNAQHRACSSSTFGESGRIVRHPRSLANSRRNKNTMWQRFTERARRVVFFAQEEAGRLGENYVSTEHLLLGLVRESDSVAARILERMGVSLGRIRSEI